MEHPDDPPSPSMRRWPQRVGRGVVFGVAGLIGTLVVGIALLQVDAVGTSVVRAVGARFAPPGLSLEVERVSGSWLRTLELIDARLVDATGAPAFAIDSLRIEWHLPALLSRQVALTRLEAVGPEVHLVRSDLGVVGLRGATPAAPQSADTTASPWTVTVAGAHVAGFSGDLRGADQALPTLEWDEGAADVTDVHLGANLTARLQSLSIRAEAPAVAGAEAAGPLRITAAGSLVAGRLRLDTLMARGEEIGLWAGGEVALPEADGTPGPMSFNLVAEGFPLALLHGALGRTPDATARVDGTVGLSGTTHRPEADLDLRLRNGGHISGTASGALGEGPARIVAQLAVEELDPGRILADSAWSGRVDGRIDVALEGPELSRLSGRADFDVSTLEVVALPLDRLGMESVWVAGEAALDLRVEADLGTATLTGTARPLDSIPTYDLGGDVAMALRLDSVPPVAAAGRLQLSGTGITLDDARAVATLQLASLSAGGARLDTLDARASLADGSISWRLDGRDGATGTLRAAGVARPGTPTTLRVDSATVTDLDLADLLGEPAGSRIDARASGSVTLDDLRRADARFDLRVRQARWGTIRVDTTVAIGRLADGVVTSDLRVRSSAGMLAGALTARPFEATPRVDVDSLDFRDLDLGALADSAAASFSTRLSGRVTGRVEARSADEATAALALEIAPSSVNRQAVAGGAGQLRLNDGLVTADLTIELPDSGRVALEARARPFRDRPSVEVDALTFEGVDPFAFAGTAPGGMNARLTGRATGRAEGTDPSSFDGEMALELAASRFNRASITGGRIDASMRGGRWDAEGDIRLSDGRLTLDADGGLATDTATWALDLDLQSESPGRLVGARVEEGRIDATVHVDGRGFDPATLSARFSARADSAAFGDVQVDTLRLTGRLADGFAHIDTLTLRSNVADATGGGVVAFAPSAAPTAPDAAPLAGVSDLSIDVALRSLTPLETWVGIEPLGLGEGRITASVEGAPDALRWTAQARASALLLGGTELLGLEADATGSLDPGLVLSSFAGDLHLDRLTALGVDVQVSNMSAAWDGDDVSIEGDATVDDRRDVAFNLRADARGERPRATLERFDVRIDDDRWALTGSPTVAWGGGLEFDSLTLQSGDQLIGLDGRFDPAGTSDLSAQVEALRLGGLTDLLGYERLDGTLTSSFRLEGPADAPRVDGELQADLVWAGGGRSGVRAALTYDSLLLDVDARIEAEGGGELTVTGGIPVDLALTPTAEGDTTRLASATEGRVDLAIQADSFAIAWIEPFLDPATARGLAGRLEIDARVQGTQASPSLSGRARLRDGRLTIPTLGVTYDRAALDLALEGDRARIDSARVNTDDGTMTLTGGVNLPQLSLGEFDLEARLDRFRAVHNDAYRVRVSGTTELVGTTQAPRLEGDLQLVETDVYLDDAVPSGASVRPIELTEDELRELEEYLGFSVRTPEREPGALFELLTLDVAVSANRDTWVRQRANPQMEIQVTGDTRVTKQPGDSLHFDGQVEAVARRSWVEQFGRRFSIQEGVVELRGTAPETRVDVQAVYEVPSTTDGQAQASITLDVEGTLNDLSLTLGSEPSMENADIVSYLARGRPASSSLDMQGDDEGGGLRGIGSDFALGQVTGLVEGLAAEGVGLDVVEIQTDGLRGATLIAGRFVTPSVYVGFKQPVGRSPEEGSGGGGSFDQTEVELEIQALQWLLLNMEAGNSTISFLFRFRYAY